MPKLYFSLCSIIWVTLAAFEGAHDLSGRPWGNMAPIVNAVGFVLVPFWFFCAYAVWTHFKNRSLYMILGTFTAFAHGIILFAAGDKRGSFFILGALMLITLNVRSIRFHWRTESRKHA